MKKLIKPEDLWAIWIAFFLFISLPILDKIPTIPKWDINIFNELILNDIFVFTSIFVGFSVFFSLALKSMQKNFKKFVIGFTFIFLFSSFALIISSQITSKAYGFGYAFWALLCGILISNTIGVPKWVKPALKTEFYIKTGLVLLGAEILFPKILDIGLPTFTVTWLVTSVVLISMYYFWTRYLKLGKHLSAIIATSTSARSMSATCNGKKEELTLTVTVTLIFTVLMMILMPILVQMLELSLQLGGTWIGGTIDTTGAVVKMIQNIIIGIVAFGIAIILTLHIKHVSNTQTISFLNEIWYRLPKFILGFMAVSVLFSFILYPIVGEAITNDLIDTSKSYRGLLFTIVFAPIGLELNFKELKEHMNVGKPIILYVVGQAYNIVLTLFIAWLAFGGVLYDN